MRLAHTTLAVLLSTGCLLASTADARAQSCNNFNPMYQGNYIQVQLGNNMCAPLTGVTVTVSVTQDIKVASSTEGYNGFSMQLNANGPAGIPAPQLYWTQFVMGVDSQKVDYGGPGVSAHSQQWPSQPGIYPANNVLMGTPSAVYDTFLTIPAGSMFTWTVDTDQGTNYVSDCQFSAIDNNNTRYTTVTEYIPQQNRAPIESITMDIVGYDNSSNTTFQSGAGVITYSGASFSPSYSFPSCAQNHGTGENSNMVYGPLIGSGDTRSQTFTASVVANFRSDDCEPSTTYPPGDWAYGDYKAECPLGGPVYGVSRVYGQTWSEDIECGRPQPPYQASVGDGSACYARAVQHSDNRGYTGDGDWDSGSYKTECGFYEYVAGVSQNAISGELTSILCCPAAVFHNSCEPQVFYNSDSWAQVNPPDWDPGYAKGQCPAGQYVAGISTPAFSNIGLYGAGHALLCCTQ